MFNNAATLALSLSLVTLAASPALAQMRGSEPAKAPSRVAATSLSAAEMTKPRVEFTLMGGYRFMHGVSQNLGYLQSRTDTQAVDNTDPATPPVTNSQVDTSARNRTFSSNSLQHGFSVSGSATYWLDQSFGLGLDYTFAHTGAKIDNLYKLGLETVNVVNPDDAAVLGTKSDSKTYITDLSASGASFVSVTTTNAFVQPAGATGEKFHATTAQVTSVPVTLNFAADNRAAVSALVNTFINSEKAIPDAAGTTSNKFTAKGKIGTISEESRTMHMADALTKTVIGANNRGELHLLAGVSVPMIFQHSIDKAVIAGENATGAATQKVEYVDADPTRNFTQDIAVEAKREVESSSVATMVGPMIGLGGTFKVNDGFRLYGKFGYTPTMIGNLTTSGTTTDFAKVVNTYTVPATNNSGKVAGSTTTETNTKTASGDSHATAGGSATSFVLGARFSLTDSLGLNIEGVNQAVAGLGYTGVNAGVSLGF